MLSGNLTGDLERKFDLEISPLCDQQADSIPAIQIGESTHAYITSYSHSESQAEGVSRLGDNSASVVSFQDSSPTLWSLCLRNGTASLSLVFSARPWWVTCTGTRLAGATYDTHTCLQTPKQTPVLRSLSLKEEEEETRKTSPNLPLVSCLGVSSSFANGEPKSFSISWFVLWQSFHWLLSHWKWECCMEEWLPVMSNSSLCWSGGLKHCRTTEEEITGQPE